MARLLLTCFDRFHVALDGKSLTAFQTDKVRALLVYLAVEPQAHSRSALAQFLWPGYSEESANSSLRQTLYRLRQLLQDAKADPPWLLITRQTVQLNPAAPLQGDVITFLRLLADCVAHGHADLTNCPPCFARLEEAIGLYQGDFLADFTIADSDPFEEWRRITQEQLHLQMVDALTELGNAAELRGNDEVALQAAQRHLGLEPWLETVHRRVMRIFARRGQRAAALAQYQRCCQILADEFGIEPEQETVALYEEIQRGSTRGRREQKPQLVGAQQVERPVLAGAIPQRANLPLAATPFIGRDQALVDLVAQLQRPEVRLLTIVGIGGMGKTRLAIELGRTVQARFADGICFVELAAVRTPTALASAIATALGIPLQGVEPHKLLLQALREQQMLLILDNFEQLLSQEATPGPTAVDLLLDLLMTAPALQILVTSRERLRLRQEQIYTVQALEFVPDATAADVTQIAAVRLFVQAAQRIQAHFQVTAENLPPLLRICQLVQGMPLGLELAAAHVDQLPLVEIADAIAQSAAFLAVDWRDLPERQRSMGAVFQWSWRLLDEQERQVFCQLAVFQGSFTRAAAETIAGATLPVLTRLLHKSLLQVNEPGAVDGRYQIHELLRQFAAAELEITQEADATAYRHSTYYLSFLATQQIPIMRDAPREATAAIQAELDNVRQAWRWGAGHLPAALVEQSALALREFYFLTGLATEAIEMFTLAMQARKEYLACGCPENRSFYPSKNAGSHSEQSIEERHATIFIPDQLETLSAELRAEVGTYTLLVGFTASFLLAVGHHEKALTHATQIVRIASAMTNPTGAALGYMLWGQALRRQGKSTEALAVLTQSVSLAQQERAVNPSLMLDLEKRAYSWLASIALSSDDYVAAREHAIHQLQICRQFHMRVGEVIALTCVIDVDKAQGDYVRAQQYAEEALVIAQQSNFLWGQSLCTEHLAELAWRQGDYQRALHLYQQTLEFYRWMGRLLSGSTMAQMLGRLLLLLGDVAQARELIEHTFQLLQQLDLPARETAWFYASRARLHYCTDNLPQALADAETAWAMVRELDGGASQADALVLLGLIREASEQFDAAAIAYGEALRIYAALGQLHQTAEPRAGLARIALANGALDRALREVEALLVLLQRYPLAGFDEPFEVYLTCYRVLAAAHDPRATAIITTTHDLLMAYADRLTEQTIRQTFLENVAGHRAVQAAFVQAQAAARGAVDRTVDSEAVDRGAVDRGAVGQEDGGEIGASVVQVPLYDWREMPAVTFFAGRTTEVAQLTAWLTREDSTPQPRLISILGLGGMGKTTLGATVVKQVAPGFAVVIWRSLLNAPPLEGLLTDWLQQLARQQRSTIPASPAGQLRLLFDYLGQARCLLILDNMESLFAGEEAPGRAGVMSAGYEGYDQLLQRFAMSEHQSTLLLTSREQPYVLNRLGRQAQAAGGPLRILALEGLDPQAGHLFLQNNGLAASAAEVSSLVKTYSGNPLALQIAAATIADFFGGDVAAFQREAGGLFDGIRLVLDQQFARLSALERDLLIWLAIERQAVTPATLRANFVESVPISTFLEALQALQSRSLLVARDGNLALPNVIMEYTTAYLVEQVCQEIYALRLPIDDAGPAPIDAAIETLFFNRFALLKAQAKEYVRQIQIRLLLQPLADRLLAQHTKAQLQRGIQGLLETLRQRTPPPPGYAAGNLLNLLLHWDVDLTAYDFSTLQIWQAHLRNAHTAGLRLTGAHLRNPTFSDDFTSIQALAFHPTDELLAAGAHDGNIYLWQTADWQRRDVLSGHTNAVRSLAFAPRNAMVGGHALLVSGGADGQIHFWHLEQGQARLGHTRQRQGYIRALAFRSDGTVLISGSDDQTVCCWQVATGELRHQLTGHRGRVYAIACCAPLADGLHQGKELIFSGGEDTHIHVWDAANGEQVALLTAHQYPIRALACMPPAITRGAQHTERAWLATADESGVIYLWDLQTLRPHHHWQEDRTVIRTLSFDATGALLAGAGDNGLVRVWEPVHGRLVQTIQAHPRAVAAATFSAQTPSLLATCGYDPLIRLWNGANGQALHVLHGFRNSVYVAHFQPPNGKLLATGHADGVVRLWQVDDGPPRLHRQLVGHPSNVFTLAFSPDGARLASGSNDTTIRLWDSTTGQHLHTLYGHTQDLYSVAFSPDGRFLVSTGADQTIRLWDTVDGSEVRRFATQGCTSWSAIFHPNGQWVASGDFDHQVRLWEVATGQLLQTWPGHRWEIEKVAFSPDGAWLASAGHDGTVRLWEVANSTTQRVLQGHTAPLWSVAFHPNGRQLVSCGEDLTVRLWDLTGPADEAVPGRILTGHTEEIFTAVFHPDGHLVASASSDGSVCFWDAIDGTLRHQLTVAGPYAGMEISGVTGISNAQKAALLALGAVEEG